MRKVLSARSTSLYPLLPVLWLTAVAACAWLVRGAPGMLPVLAIVGLVPALLLARLARGLRHVSTDGRLLYVRAGWREVAVPFSSITRVREIRGTGRHSGITVVLTLDAPTPLGDEIRFVPRMRWLPDAEALRRAQTLHATDPDAAGMALWSSFSAAEGIRQRIRGGTGRSASGGAER